VASLNQRAQQINHSCRITGNALIHLVDEILRFRRRGLSDAEVQSAIEDLITSQTLNPDFRTAPASTEEPQPLLRNFLQVVHGYREDI
jgi:hypothetical protein